MYLCIQTSQQVGLLALTYTNAKNLLVTCQVSSIGLTYPCRICLPLNTTLIGHVPKLLVTSCRPQLIYEVLYNTTQVIDRKFVVQLELPNTGIYYTALSVGQGTAYVAKLHNPGIGIVTYTTEKKQVTKGITVTEVTPEVTLQEPSQLPHIWHVVAGGSIVLGSNLGYIILHPARDVTFSRILYGGYETVRLRGTGFVLLVFYRYTTGIVDRVFQWLGREIGLSQPYMIEFPNSTLVYTWLYATLNITIEQMVKNRTVIHHVLYSITYLNNTCLSKICVFVYVPYMLYQALVPNRTMIEGTGRLEVYHVLASGKPMTVTYIIGNMSRMGLVTVINTTEPISGYVRYMTYINVTRLPKSSITLTQLIYIPESRYTLQLHEIGRTTVAISEHVANGLIGKKFSTILQALESIGIPEEYASIIEGRILDEIAWKYGKNATITQVKIENANVKQLVVTYSASVYVPGSVTYVPILLEYMCGGSRCVLEFSVVPS